VTLDGSVRERFLAKIERTGGCWTWTGARSDQGYGSLGAGGRRGRTLLAHRVAYELLVGPVPDGLDLHHRCGRPDCVNPDHLEPLPRRDHLLRHGTSPAARNALKTACVRGHPLSGSNLRVERRGSRTCRECSRARDRRRVRRAA
jgi:hypothetical protein